MADEGLYLCLAAILDAPDGDISAVRIKVTDAQDKMADYVPMNAFTAGESGAQGRVQQSLLIGGVIVLIGAVFTIVVIGKILGRRYERRPLEI